MTVVAQIDSLIDKVDAWELIEDQIAEILLVEQASQQSKATTAGKDPKLWKLRIFQDRSNPWEEFKELDPNDTSKRRDQSPIVHVAFDSATFDRSKGDPYERQQADGLFNVDVYGYGVARSSGAGHVPGDEDAGDEVGRASRLVRNILMSGVWTYLGLQGTVASRWLNSIDMFPIVIDGVVLEQVRAARLVFAVSYNEFSPQYTPQLLESVGVTVNRAETGELLFAADFDETTPP